jgi:glycosyltransferase involved in cell wall biosynthesis
VYSATYSLTPGQCDRPEAHRSPSVPFFLYPDVQWAFPRFREVVEDLQAFRADVVHVATEFSLGIAGVKAARQLELPLIASAHTDYDQYAARYGVTWALRAGWHYLRWFYGQAHRVLCPSRIYEQALHRHGVLHTGLWAAGWTPGLRPRYRDEAYRAAVGAGPGDLVVTYIRTHRAGKNLGLLLEAGRTLAPEARRRALVLVGRGPLEGDIGAGRSRGSTSPGCSRVTRSPQPTRRPTSSRFRPPPRRSAIRSLEAMGSGPRRIVAAGGGVLEFAEHGRNAWLVESDSAAAIAGALRRLFSDASLVSASRMVLSPPPADGTGARSTMACWTTTARRWRREGGYEGGVEAIGREGRAGDRTGARDAAVHEACGAPVSFSPYRLRLTSAISGRTPPLLPRPSGS